MSRVFKGKDGIYCIDYNDANGVRHREKVCPNKRVAEEALNARLTDVAREQFVGPTDSKIGFAEYAKVWSDRVSPTLAERTAERWTGIVENHLKTAFKGNLRGITLEAIEGYIARRLETRRVCSKCDGAKVITLESEQIECPKCEGKGELPKVTPATVNREISVLRHMLKRAVAWKYLARNPIDGWKPLREAPGRVRFLLPDEVTRLMAACEDSRSVYLKAFVLVALNTGMRRGEVLSLTRKSIDRQNRIATLETTKNGDSGHVPLNDTAFEALRSLPARIDGKLFPYADDHAVSRSFARAVERAGLEDFHLHDLRHSFASAHAANGTQQRGLQALLRHKDTRMTARYSHLTDKYLRVAVDAVNLGADVAPAPESPAERTGTQAR
jgi:integrase